MIHTTLGVAGSFFLFAAFILELFVMIGQLSNKPFLNLIYFLKANNPEYNLSYSFSLWSYCQSEYKGPVQSCSKAIAAYNWATTPGFEQMLPGYTSSRNLERIFLAFFILYFIGLIFTFLLWIFTLPIAIIRSNQNGRGKRPFDIVMATFTLLTFLIMLVVLIIALVVVINGVKAISGASIYWNGHAGNALWLTIAAVVSLFLAMVCYLFKACSYGAHRTPYGKVTPADDKMNANKNTPFDLTPHQGYYYQSPVQPATQLQQPTIPHQPHAFVQPVTTTSTNAATEASKPHLNPQQDAFVPAEMSQQY